VCTLLHATVYMFLHNLLNVLVQIANKMEFKKKKIIGVSNLVLSIAIYWLINKKSIPSALTVIMHVPQNNLARRCFANA
jgi:hypothetical protein